MLGNKNTASPGFKLSKIYGMMLSIRKNNKEFSSICPVACQFPYQRVRLVGEAQVG
jgi:hypothetical protein